MLKVTVKGAWQAATGVAVNDETGFGKTVIDLVTESLHAPKLLTSLTLNVPVVE